MFRPLVSFVLLAVSVTACARENPAAAPVAAPADVANETAEAPAPAAQPATQGDETQQATAAQESSGDATEEERSDAKLERLAALPANQQLPAGRWKAGENYEPIVPAQPTNVAPDKVEVVEFFWYGCPHCYALEPYIASWVPKKPAYVEFVRVPITWSPVHQAQARLFYTLESLGRGDLHTKVFEAVQQNHRAFAAPSEEQTLSSQLEFAKANGIDAQAYTDAFKSFSVNSSLQRASQAKDRYAVQSVPHFVVNGKYATDVGHAGGQNELFALINDLAASERRR
jgi:thiol:disulfide interchange protein DsbA